ncbi:MAG: HAD-IC family P-type ATPase [Candidatus Berkelbacteria bacterium]
MNNQNGLSNSDIAALQIKYGRNSLKEKPGPSVFYIFISQFSSPIVYILLIASLLSLYFKEYTNFWVIIAVVLVNASIGFYQEYSARKTLSALKKMLQPKATVIRGGKRSEIEAINLVPGDIVVLAAGDQIPADGKTVESTNLLVSESILTGEEDAVDKKPDENGLLFMGTTVLSGIGIMEVQRIGDQAKIGKINQELAEIPEGKTPLEKKLADFSRSLILIVFAISLLLIIFGLFKEKNFWTTFEFAIVLAIAAIPEGLPIAATVILSLGMKRILKHNGLVKKLLSVETLGSTSVICTDKTGTLTEGKMRVVEANLSNDKHAFLSLILANQQKDTLEVCLWKYVESKSSLHPKKILDSVEKVYEEPFDSQKKYSLSIIKDGSSELGYILGAPEIVLDFCQVDDKNKEKIKNNINEWASRGLKVIGAAYKDKGNLKTKSEWQWLGIVGVEDPIRPEVVETIKQCQNAGIQVKIVTGDYLVTAIQVAKQIGLEAEAENIMEAGELDNISDYDLEEKIGKITVFSRISPEQKLKIIKALQNKGEVVAMTGDGVNDALALKKADIAVVVANASDVAKEVADLILLDSNFKTIYLACQEGRTIVSNIKKVVSFVLSNSFVGIVAIFSSILLNLPSPITVIMILWLNLICDGPIDIMLGFEEREVGEMQKTPLAIQKENIIDRFVIQTSVILSLFVGLSATGLFYFFSQTLGDLSLGRTVAFGAISTASLIYIFSFKNLHQKIFEYKNIFKNKYLIFSVIYGLTLTALVIYLPILNKLFETKPLGFVHWLLILSVGILSTLIVEISKRAKA